MRQANVQVVYKYLLWRGWNTEQVVVKNFAMLRVIIKSWFYCPGTTGGGS